MGRVVNPRDRAIENLDATLNGIIRTTMMLTVNDERPELLKKARSLKATRDQFKTDSRLTPSQLNLINRLIHEVIVLALERN